MNTNMDIWRSGAKEWHSKLIDRGLEGSQAERELRAVIALTARAINSTDEALVKDLTIRLRRAIIGALTLLGSKGDTSYALHAKSMARKLDDEALKDLIVTGTIHRA